MARWAQMNTLERVKDAKCKFAHSVCREVNVLGVTDEAEKIGCSEVPRNVPRQVIEHDSNQKHGTRFRFVGWMPSLSN
jgi:hypothetical protein